MPKPWEPNAQGFFYVDGTVSIKHKKKQTRLSQTGLYMKIQSLTGLNPSGFVRTVRLKYAERMLVQNEKSIKSICFDCGFNSQAYFSKTFKELYGKTPSEYLEDYLNQGTDH